MKNLWLLSEEKPRIRVVLEIVKKFCKDSNYNLTFNEVKIIPILKDKKFTFVYQVQGIKCNEVEDIFIRIVSGKSSFVDYLVFYQDDEPNQKSIPIYAIEETKTDDSESRNTGVYQRCTKFVFVDLYFPKIKKIMLYNLQIAQKIKPTKTNTFGTRMLSTIGVEILGKKLELDIEKPFSNIDELIQAKNSVGAPPKGNVPIVIKKYEDKITISGRLYKSGGLSHDPNIGALTVISYCLRKLGWEKDILVTSHGLSQSHVGRDNKFIKISNKLGIKLEGLSVPISEINKEYWHNETTSEKNATIFLHLIIDQYTQGKVIYENHGGCERGYLYDKSGKPIVVAKYQEGLKESYKSGNKKAIISLPDLTVFDIKRNYIIDIEGKKYSTRKKGIAELSGYDYIENNIMKPLYNPLGFIRTVVIFGSTNNAIQEDQISFMLNENGKIVVNDSATAIIKEAVDNLFSSQ